MPDETREAFTDDGWFRTGDEGTVENGYWRIVGRRSIDIIKTGGYKVAAPEIEACLRMHPGVVDAAVVGVVDAEWGERVCAAVVLRPGGNVSVGDLREWCRGELAPYKVPKQLAVVSRLPRNAMGKALKGELHAVFALGDGDVLGPVPPGEPDNVSG
jgi:malonyl-CoA/methylmalonyl-CoA synthetase